MEKKSIRPILKISVKDASIDERFQNETLRPIIKLQHELIILFISTNIKSQKINFLSINKEKQVELIREKLSKENTIREYIKGLISGLFDIEEYRFYLKNKSTLNKRIIQITEKRIVDSLDEVIELLK